MRTCLFVAGKPRLPDMIARIKGNRDEENQRLLYVALTRARHHLYMPFFPATDSDDREVFVSEKDHGDYKTFDKITGPYRHVNDRLRHLAADREDFAALFTVQPVPFPAPELPAAPWGWKRRWRRGAPRRPSAPPTERTGDVAGLRAARAAGSW